MRASDHDIVKAICQGSKSQFAQLVDRYKDRAMTLAVRILRNREDAEEAVQDAFMRAYNSLGKFEGASKFGTWFYRIVYNVCLTKLGRRKDDFLPYSDQGEGDVEGPGGLDPHQLLESKDLLSKTKEAMDELPERYRSVLSLFYFQELSYEEIAGVTEQPIGTVKAHLFRARAFLQKKLLGRFEGVLMSRP